MADDESNLSAMATWGIKSSSQFGTPRLNNQGFSFSEINEKLFYCSERSKKYVTTWWFFPIHLKNMPVKLELISPSSRGENSKNISIHDLAIGFLFDTLYGVS